MEKTSVLSKSNKTGEREAEPFSTQSVFWRMELQDLSPLELPKDKTCEKNKKPVGESLSLPLGRDVVQKLNRLCEDNDATLYSSLLSVFMILLNKYTGQDDLCVGGSLNFKIGNGAENTLSTFDGILPIRSRLSTADSYLELLAEVNAKIEDVFNNRKMHFTEIVINSKPEGQTSSSSPFQVAMILGETSDRELPLFNEFAANDYPIDFLMYWVEIDGELRGKVVYDSVSFSKLGVERIVNHFCTLLDRVLDEPESRIQDLEIISKDEKHQLIFQWNDRNRPYPKDKCLHRLFEEQVKKTPHNTALEFEGEEISYRELNDRADRLGGFLQKRGVRPETLVGFYVERSIDMVVGLLGILKAGGAYVPIDPTYPKERIALILDDCECSLLLTQKSIRSSLSVNDEMEIICIDERETAEEIASANLCETATDVRSDNLVYITYTSGSTGKPKGVLVEHRNLVNFLFGMQNEHKISEADRFLGLTTISFDPHALELFLPLITGASVHIASKQALKSPNKLTSLIEKNRITYMQATPAALTMLLEEDWKLNCPLTVLCGGEALREGLRQRITRIPGVTLYNVYGPTETTVWATSAEIGPDNAITIGKPIANVNAYVLDANNVPVPIGIPGEMCISGDGVTRGYMKRPELTAEKFIKNPFGHVTGSRLYKTGDLVRYLPDGNIEFLGRVDDQIKIRGFRMEPGEIETALNQLNDVKTSKVVAKDDKSGNKWLVAYIVPSIDGEIDKEGIRKSLSATLPVYMIPQLFVILDAMPLSPNGKVDKKALPDPENSINTAQDYIAPESDMEKILARYWKEILGFEEIGILDNFFELGGDSIKAIQIINKVYKHGIDLDLEQFFEHPTISGLTSIGSYGGQADHRTKERGVYAVLSESAEKIVLNRFSEAENVEDAYPLTYMQTGLLFHEIDNPHSGLYIEVYSYNINGDLNVEAFSNAWQSAIDRHSSLRTSFHREGLNEILQVVQKELPVECRYDDWRDLDGNERSRRLSEYIESCRTKGFNLEKAPLFNLRVVRNGKSDYSAVFSFHHLLMDGWSFYTLLEEVFTEYNALCKGERPVKTDTRPYKDYVYWLNGQDINKAENIWRGLLSGFTQPTPVGIGKIDRTMQRNPAESNPLSEQYQVSDIVLNEQATKKLNEIAQNNSLTLNTIIQGVWALILSCYSGENDVLFGSIVSNRPAELEHIENSLGLFLNAVPVRAKLEPEDDLLSFFKNLQKQQIALYQYSHTPIQQIQNWSELPRGTQLFNTVISFVNVPNLPFLNQRNGEIIIDVDQYLFRTSYPLTLLVIPADEIRLRFAFDRRFFSEEVIARLSGHMRTVLDGIVYNPFRKIYEISMLSAGERQRILEEWNKSEANFPDDICIHKLFEKQVEKTPDSLALICGNKELSYRELNNGVNKLANRLISSGVESQSIVGLCANRSVEMVIGLLAVLKVGAAYLPLDPAYPSNRLSYMLEDSQVSLLLVQNKTIGSLPEYDGKIINLDTEELTVTLENCPNPQLAVPSSSLAYIIYTSGSTGAPKGVMNHHKGLVNYAWWAKNHYIKDEKLSFPLFTSLSFDLTVTSIFIPLISGGRIHIYTNDDDTGRDVSVFDVISDNKVDIMKLTPSQLALVKDVIPDSSKLKKLILGGEDLKSQLAQNINTAFDGNVEIYNEYGPTEATVGCMTYLFRSEQDVSGSVPIGVPAANVRLYILDGYLNPVPVGVKGELFISSPGLAKGYLHKEKLTAERFIPNPFVNGDKIYRTGDLARWRDDGNMEFLGRIDNQIKLLGYRIELGEIEAALADFNGISESAVTVRSYSEIRQNSMDKRCIRCGMSANYPGITMDSDGICSMCLSYDEHKDEAARYFKTIDDLKAFFSEARKEKDRPYDCLVLFSGGKDSTYMLCQLVKMGLKVLAYTFDNGYIYQGTKDNISRVVKQLNIDHVFDSFDGVNEILCDSLKRHSNVCNGCFKAIYTLSTKIAYEKGIKYVVTGLSRGQLFETRLMDLFNGNVQVDQIDQHVLEARKVYHRMDDAVSRLIDVKDFESDEIFEDVNYLDFYRYSDVTENEIFDFLTRELPWRNPSNTGCTTNCVVNDVGIHVHLKERHYHNYALPESWEVRLGHSTREEAVEKLNAEVDLERVAEMLNEIGYVSPSKDESSDDCLVAYYVSGNPVDLSELKRHLAESLPEYMIPSYFMQLEELPINTNGKVNREELPLPGLTRPDVKKNFIAPRGDIEQNVASIWQSALNVENIGIHDNFFDLGGHSMLMAQVHNSLQKLFDIDLSIIEMFDYPTINSLCDYLRKERKTNEDDTGNDGMANRIDERRLAMKQRRQRRQRSLIGKSG